MRKYTVEFIGTFFLFLAIGLSAPLGSFAPLAIGSMLMVMVYAGGHISGAHYNPAVSLGIWLRGNFPARELLPYMIAQVAGAVLASFLAGYLGEKPSAAISMQVNAALLAEFLGTFALVYVILNVATAKGTEGNSFYGLAIGFTVAAAAYALGGVSGGAFNPAVAIASCMSGAFSWPSIWMYLVANFAAGAVAAYAFKFTANE